MGGIFWVKSHKQWAADYVDPRSKARKRWYLGRDELEARRLFHTYMAALYGGESDRVAGRITLQDLADAWLDWNETNCALGTAYVRRCYLNWIVPRHGRTPAHLISPQVVERIKSQQCMDHAPMTINHFVRAIKGLYKWGLEQGFIDSNQMAHVHGVPAGPRKRLALPIDRALKACEIADCSPPLGDWLRILLYTGCRKGELEGLSWADWDRSRGILWVGKHKTVGRTGQPRRLAVSDKAAAVLGRQPEWGRAIFSDESGMPLRASRMYSRLKRLRKKHPEELAGVTFHAFRHTFCSQLAIRKVHPFQARALMGHRSTVMTLYYTDFDDQTLKDAVDRL